jgi:hypothetical protein
MTCQIIGISSGPPGIKAVDVKDVAKLAVAGAVGELSGKIYGNGSWKS